MKRNLFAYLPKLAFSVLLPFNLLAMLTPSAGVSATASAVATDLTHIDSDVAHFTQSGDGLIHAQVYMNPVGFPDSSGWRLRSTSPSASSPVSSPSALVPFALHLPASSGPAAQASLTNEDQATLGISLASINGVSPSIVPGRIDNRGTTYASVLPSTDLTLQPTLAGFTLRLTLHSPQQQGWVDLVLHLDPHMSAQSDAAGAILITRTVQACGSTGCGSPQHPAAVEQPEFVIGKPIVRDSNPISSSMLNAPTTTVQLGSRQSDQQPLTLAIAPRWLAVPARVFPVTVDVPILTAPAAINSGTFATVNSCASTTSLPMANMVVGVYGDCVLRGEVFFNMASPTLQRPVQHATLNLYTPNQSGQTGVVVLPNAPPPLITMPPPPTTQSAAPPNAFPPVPSSPRPIPAVTPVGQPVPHPPSWQPPSWSTSPPTMPNAAIIAQSGTDGHWQSWDITSIVQQWLRHGLAGNNGLTLEAATGLVQFASPLDAANADPAIAPYLDITFAPVLPSPSQSKPQFKDVPGQSTIFGLAGVFTPDGTCPSGYLACVVPNTSTYATEYLAGTLADLQYVRGGDVTIPCSVIAKRLLSYH